MDVPIIIVSGPGETGLVSAASPEHAAKQYSTHWENGKAGLSIRENGDAVNESACRASYSAGRESSKRRHISCSTTPDPGKRLKPADFLQPRSVSFQDINWSKGTRTASPNLITREENQFGLSTSDNVSDSKGDRSRIGQPPPHYWSVFTRDIVSLAIKQHQVVCLDTSSRMEKGTTNFAQPASCQYAAMGRQWHDLERFTRSSAARFASMAATHATGSDNQSQRSSTTTHAQKGLTGSGFATRSAKFMDAQTAGLGVGDGGDDPDDHNKRFKPLRSHEIDTADGGRQLMLDACAKFHQQSQSQRPKDSESSMEEDQDRPRYGRGRSYSCSKNTTQSLTVGLAQRSESAPARTQYPQRVNRDGPNPENDSPPRREDQDLQQALICRSRMVRASDITGEPTVDAPWTHHMRPSALLQLRKGAEGYGGYGGLASLPDADTSSRAENGRVAPETPLGASEYDAMKNQTARNRDSFSFTSSSSSIVQHVALAEEPVEKQDDSGLAHDQYSIVSQHTALADGPPEELIYTYALQNRGLLEAFFDPTITDMETCAHIECSEPRRPSVPHITPQAPSDSSLVEDLSIYTKSRTGSIRHGIRERCKEKRRQESSWSTVLCCLGNIERDRQSSPEDERSSSETPRSEKPTSQHCNQDRKTSGGPAEECQGPFLGQRPARTDMVQAACGRVPEQSPAVIDSPATFDKFAESESDPRIT